jgi:hypothetical protein
MEQGLAQMYDEKSLGMEQGLVMAYDQNTNHHYAGDLDLRARKRSARVYKRSKM